MVAVLVAFTGVQRRSEPPTGPAAPQVRTLPYAPEPPDENLISDTARGHGRVRIAPAACVLHGDEPALLAEIAAHRRLAKLGLRQVAPTVLVSRSPIDVTLAALRAEGYAPVAETAEGTVRIDAIRARRAAAPVPAPRGSSGRGGFRIAGTVTAKVPAAVDANALAARLLAAPPEPPEPAPFDGGAPFGTDTEEIVSGVGETPAVHRCPSARPCHRHRWGRHRRIRRHFGQPDRAYPQPPHARPAPPRSLVPPAGRRARLHPLAHPQHHARGGRGIGRGSGRYRIGIGIGLRPGRPAGLAARRCPAPGSG